MYLFFFTQYVRYENEYAFKSRLFFMLSFSLHFHDDDDMKKRPNGEADKGIC